MRLVLIFFFNIKFPSGFYCDKCGSKLLQRKDDNVETVESRIDTYLKNTSPLVEYYTKQNKISTQLVSKTVNKLGANVAKDILEQIK